MTFIEELPDELWLKIFSYFPWLDLFHYFSGLNQRIEAILHSKRLKIKLKSNLSYEKSKILIDALPEYVIGLYIDYYNQNIDISSFKNLLSLHLSHATDKQIEDIKSHYLEYLNQLDIVVCSTNNQLGDILFSEKQLNYLTTCWLPNLDFYFDDKKFYQPCFTLCSLRLNYCHINTFLNILYYLPNLISFESALVCLPSSNQSISFPLIKHLCLIHLKILLRTNVPLFDLESMLIHISCLEQLHLTIDRFNISQKDFKLVELTNIIQNQALNLKKFHIKINLLSTNLKMNHDDWKKTISLYSQKNIHPFERSIATQSDLY
ncbi:unnamed protein product [Rotaria sordida]|uniref:F-box domain-containing protein n=1 Tax=Rotaria sordida TaxID=392033 RepID=A0A813VE07_9BILA|nr:unnamed protein product [Rotaria sordida]CAF0859950.1 unnamed protein product [Rotaria sordida]